MSSTACSAAMAAINLAAGILAGSKASSSERPLRARTSTPGMSRAGASCAKSTQSRRSAKTPERRLVERAVGEQAALADDDDPFRQRLDVVHVVGREQHGHVLLAVETLHEIANGKLRRRIEADRRFVEEQDLGIMEQGCRELGAHALAERELADGLGQQRFEAQQGHELVAPATIALGRDPVDVGQQIEAVEDRQVPPELAALAEHHADPGHMAETILVGHEASDFDPPAGRPQDPRQDLDGRRLARAVRPDEGEQLAGLEAEGEVDQRLHLAPTPAHEAAQRTGKARRAFGDAIGLGQRLNQDLGHDGARRFVEKGAEPMGRQAPGQAAAAPGRGAVWIIPLSFPSFDAGRSRCLALIDPRVVVADAELARPGKNFRSSFHSVLLDRAEP